MMKNTYEIMSTFNFTPLMDLGKIYTNFKPEILLLAFYVKLNTLSSPSLIPPFTVKNEKFSRKLLSSDDYIDYNKSIVVIKKSFLEQLNLNQTIKKPLKALIYSIDQNFSDDYKINVSNVDEFVDAFFPQNFKYMKNNCLKWLDEQIILIKEKEKLEKSIKKSNPVAQKTNFKL